MLMGRMLSWMREANHMNIIYPSIFVCGLFIEVLILARGLNSSFDGVYGEIDEIYKYSSNSSRNSRNKGFSH